MSFWNRTFRFLAGPDIQEPARSHPCPEASASGTRCLRGKRPMRFLSSAIQEPAGSTGETTNRESAVRLALPKERCTCAILVAQCAPVNRRPWPEFVYIRIRRVARPTIRAAPSWVREGAKLLTGPTTPRAEAPSVRASAPARSRLVPRGPSREDESLTTANPPAAPPDPA